MIHMESDIFIHPHYHEKTFGDEDGQYAAYKDALLTRLGESALPILVLPGGETTTPTEFTEFFSRDNTFVTPGVSGGEICSMRDLCKIKTLTNGINTTVHGSYIGACVNAFLEQLTEPQGGEPEEPILGLLRLGDVLSVRKGKNRVGRDRISESGWAYLFDPFWSIVDDGTALHMAST